MEKSQPFRRNLLGEKTDPGGVAARPGKAGDKTKRDWIASSSENDRDRCGRSFGRLNSSGRAGRSDNGDATADEVSHERRKAIVSAVQPIVLDHHVLPLDVAGFVEALAERSGMARGGIGWPAGDKRDGRHGGLLRSRRERPHRRAAEQRDELPSSHVGHGGLLPRLSQRRTPAAPLAYHGGGGRSLGRPELTPASSEMPPARIISRCTSS